MSYHGMHEYLSHAQWPIFVFRHLEIRVSINAVKSVVLSVFLLESGNRSRCCWSVRRSYAVLPRSDIFTAARPEYAGADPGFYKKGSMKGAAEGAARVGGPGASSPGQFWNLLSSETRNPRNPRTPPPTLFPTSAPGMLIPRWGKLSTVLSKYNGLFEQQISPEIQTVPNTIINVVIYGDCLSRISVVCCLESNLQTSASEPTDHFRLCASFNNFFT